MMLRWAYQKRCWVIVVLMSAAGLIAIGQTVKSAEKTGIASSPSELNRTHLEPEWRVVDLKSKLVASSKNRDGFAGSEGLAGKTLGEAEPAIQELLAELDAVTYMAHERESEINKLRSELQKVEGMARDHSQTIESLEFHRLVLAGLLIFSFFSLGLAFRPKPTD